MNLGNCTLVWITYNMVSRRQFFIASAGVGAAFVIPAIWSRRANSQVSTTVCPRINVSQFTESLPVPYAKAPLSNDLTIERKMHQFHSSLPAGPTLAYNYVNNNVGTILGPIIEIPRGTPLNLTFHNNIQGTHPLANAIDTNFHGALASDTTAPRTSVHLHGGNDEPSSDGYPEATFSPGQSYLYKYINNQEAATLWYHDHALGITSENALSGLAGMYFIRDADDPIGGNGPLGIPAGQPYEIPLVLQDRYLKPDGSMCKINQPPWEIHYAGNIATINGKAWPKLAVDRTLYRFRIVNGSGARTYNLSLSSNQPIIQIGTDQGFLNAPVYLNSLLLTPGERADVLIDFSNSLPGTQIVLKNSIPSPYPDNRYSGFINDPALPQLMMFVVNQGATNPKPIPHNLRLNKPQITPLSVAQAVRHRYLTLVDLYDQSGNTVAMTHNFVFWAEATANSALREQPKVDTIEVWHFINLMVFSHPMHLHAVPFQILKRQKFDTAKYFKAYLATGKRQLMHPVGGLTSVPANYPPPNPTPYLIGQPRPPLPNEMGWKDMALSYPGEVTSIIIPFGANAAPNLPFVNSFTGRYVWHCHIFGHEDNEMMMPFDIVP